MRLKSAALLGAAAALPALVQATTVFPDPTDVAAPVPAATVPSVFEGYRPYSETASPSWRQLNQAVTDKPPQHAVHHDGGAGASKSNGHSMAAPSTHGESTP